MRKELKIKTCFDNLINRKYSCSLHIIIIMIICNIIKSMSHTGLDRVRFLYPHLIFIVYNTRIQTILSII